MATKGSRKANLQTAAEASRTHIERIKRQGRIRNSVEISTITATKLKAIGYTRGCSMGAVIDLIVAEREA